MSLLNYLNSPVITALATGLLVIVGVAQVVVLIAQKRQSRLELVTEYKKRWLECREFWGKVVFIGRNQEEYYQVVDENSLKALESSIKQSQLDRPTLWAQESIRMVCGILSETCIRVLNGQLYVTDAYSIFGTELLRHSKPLRILLDTNYKNSFGKNEIEGKHSKVRNEMQDWLIYHDGIRRRCLILIDLIWAEATRLEDLPPTDIQSAANAKIESGNQNKSRVFNECYRLNGIKGVFSAWKLSCFLKYGEYRTFFNRKGISKKRLKKLDSIWTKRLLRK